MLSISLLAAASSPLANICRAFSRRVAAFFPSLLQPESAAENNAKKSMYRFILSWIIMSNSSFCKQK